MSEQFACNLDQTLALFDEFVVKTCLFLPNDALDAPLDHKNYFWFITEYRKRFISALNRSIFAAHLAWAFQETIRSKKHFANKLKTCVHIYIFYFTVTNAIHIPYFRSHFQTSKAQSRRLTKFAADRWHLSLITR